MTQHAKVPDFALQLKAAREASGKSLVEIAAALKLPVTYLEQLEAGDTEEPFLRMSLKAYVQYLALPLDEIEDLFLLEKDKQQAAMAFLEESEQASTPARKMLPLFLVMIVLLLMALGAFFYKPWKPPIYLERYEELLADGASGIQAPTLPVLYRGKLDIQVNEESWITLYDAHRNRILYDLLKPPSEYSFELMLPGELVIGYAPGVVVYLNDKPVPLEINPENNVAILSLEKEPLITEGN